MCSAAQEARMLQLVTIVQTTAVLGIDITANFTMPDV